MRITKKLLIAILSASAIAGCSNSAVKTPPAVVAGPVVEAPKPRTSATYGKAFQDGPIETVSAAAVFANPTAYNHKVIRMTGTVGPVCKVKGCWMTVVDPKFSENLFIKFPDPPQGRLVPLDAPGHESVLEGEFVIAKLSEAFARHLAEDRNASEEEIQKIVGPQRVYTLKNPAVRIYDLAAATQPAQE